MKCSTPGLPIHHQLPELGLPNGAITTLLMLLYLIDYFSSDGKVSAYSAGDLGSIPGSDPWVSKIPQSRKWQPTLIFLLGEFHGQRSLLGYSPWYDKTQM